MCGILFGINCYGDISNISNIVKNASAINNRGPDKTSIGFDNKAMWLFHRLAIRSASITNSSRSDFIENDRYLLLCNGEVYVPEGYNYTLNDPLKNYQSDCDFILEEFMVNGIEGVKNLLRYSEYALVIYDKILKNIVLVLRDRFGIRPLFRIEDPNNGDVIFTSEIKYVVDESLDKKFERIRVNNNHTVNNNYIITQVPGYYEKPYQSIKQSSNTKQYLSLEQKTGLLHNTLNASIYDRISTSDTPVGYLLSGGMDSSIICAMAARLIQPKKIRTFAIGLDPNATDVIAAKVVADFIGSEHTTIILKPQDFLSHVRETIYFEETYDITTIRAGVAMNLIAKYIRNNTDIRVVITGEGSDELFGSYRYFLNAPSAQEHYDETLRLLRDISYFDVLRCDRTISNNGLEARVPFLDTRVVDCVHNTFSPEDYVVKSGLLKYILRNVAKTYNLLPESIYNRPKEALSDGISTEELSWFEILQKEYGDEKRVYKEIYTEYFGEKYTPIPYYWLPRWCGDEADPSARKLNVSESYVE